MQGPAAVPPPIAPCSNSGCRSSMSLESFAAAGLLTCDGCVKVQRGSHKRVRHDEGVGCLNSVELSHACIGRLCRKSAHQPDDVSPLADVIQRLTALSPEEKQQVYEHLHKDLHIIIEIADFSAEMVESCLRFLYSGNLILNCDKLVDSAAFADRY